MRKVLETILASMARITLARYSPKVVGITGSVGKTTAKEMITVVLQHRYRVRGNIKSYNNQIGLPLTIIGQETRGRSLFGWFAVLVNWIWSLIGYNDQYPEVLVLEMGADRQGDIEHLTSIAPCDVAVLTAIAGVHLEHFGTIEAVESEKKKIVRQLKSGSLAVLNADDERVVNTGVPKGADILTYGMSNEAMVRATDAHYKFADNRTEEVETTFKVSYRGSSVPVHIRGAVGGPAVMAALAAICVGLHFGMNLIEIANALRNYTPTPGRLRVLAGVKDSFLIDDTYNSSPRAALAAVDLLAEIPNHENGRRYAVLADMLELGAETEARHEEVGRRVAEQSIDVLVCVGERARAIARAARKTGMNPDNMFCFGLAEDAARFLKDRIREHDIVLIKGSQGMRMERAVKVLMAEPERADVLLVRQTQEWRGR